MNNLFSKQKQFTKKISKLSPKKYPKRIFHKYKTQWEKQQINRHTDKYKNRPANIKT